MSEAKLIPLSTWASRILEDPPSQRTLRRWVQAGNIIPRPRKFGRTYMVPASARYIDTSNPDYLQDVAEALESSPQ